MSASEQIKSFCLSRVGHAYVYGGTGQRCTPAYRRARKAQYPAFASAIDSNCPVLSGRAGTCIGCRYNGRFVYDCAQLTSKAAQAAGIKLPSGATTQWRTAPWARKGTIDTLPRDEVAFLYRERGGRMMHTGVYLGDGTVVDARGHAAGVLHRGLNTYPWTHWAQLLGMGEVAAEIPLPDVLAPFAPVPKPSVPSLNNQRMLRIRRGRPLMRGDDVRFLQRILIARGYSVGTKGDDGVYGHRTRAAVMAFQRGKGLKVDGVVGPRTWAAIHATA